MKDSSIQWTDHTFNPWEGCTKVAPECKNCYAETLVDHRFGRAKWGKGQPRRRTSENLWKQPLRWNKFAGALVCNVCGLEYAGMRWDSLAAHEAKDSAPLRCMEPGCAGTLSPRRARVFCLSLGDWLDEEVPVEWLADLLFLIWKCRNLDFQLLTKRTQNWQPRIEEVFNFVRLHQPRFDVSFTRWLMNWMQGIAPDNIWIGVSAGADQKAALEIPAKIHFLSCEPMLHALDEEQNHITQKFDWIIFGGESGKRARPCDVSWIRDGLKFCQANGIAAFVKQFGARPFENHEVTPTPEEADCWHRCGWTEISFADGSGRRPIWNKNYRLRDSHGGDMSEWPEDLRIREFPKA